MISIRTEIGYFAIVSLVAVAQALDDGLERLALEPLHDEVEAALLVGADVVDRHDVRVIEATHHPHLVDEAHQRARVVVLMEALDRDLATDVLVGGQRHLSRRTRRRRGRSSSR